MTCAINCHPVGAWARGGRRLQGRWIPFQGLTPLAIDLRPFGTEEVRAGF